MEFGWILRLEGVFKIGCVKSCQHVCWRARASLESCNSARPLFWAIPTLQTRINNDKIRQIWFHNMFSMLDSYSLWRRPKSVCHQELVAPSSPVSNLFHFFHIFSCSQHYLGTHITWTFFLYQPFSSFLFISHAKHASVVVPEPQHPSMKATSHILICRRVKTTVKYAFQCWKS